jgi:hypothetical protein
MGKQTYPRINPADYRWEDGDVMDITHDDGERWDEWASIKRHEVGIAASRTAYSQGQSNRFRIRRPGLAGRDYPGGVVFGS